MYHPRRIRKESLPTSESRDLNSRLCPSLQAILPSALARNCSETPTLSRTSDYTQQRAKRHNVKTFAWRESSTAAGELIANTASAADGQI